MGVYSSDGQRIEKFDPLTLYWSRQDSKSGLSAITIQGGRDFDYVDIFQVIEKDNNKIRLRIFITENMELINGDEKSLSPGHAPILLEAKYVIRVGVFGENCEPRICWFVLEKNPKAHFRWPYLIRKISHPKVYEQ